MSSNRTVATTINFRLPVDLAEKLSRYTESLRFPSDSRTYRFFIELGIKSHETLHLLKEKPELNEKIHKEWKEHGEKLSNEYSRNQALSEISEIDLEMIMKYSWIEYERRHGYGGQDKFSIMEAMHLRDISMESINDKKNQGNFA